MARGSINKRTHKWTTKDGEEKVSVKWEARYRTPDGKRQPSKSFPTKKAAEEWLNAETARIVRNDWTDPAERKITLREYAERWQANQVGAPNTLALTDNALRLHILPVLGDMPLASIRRSDVQKFVKILEAKVTRPETENRPARLMAPRNVRNIHGKLVGMLESAVDDGLIPRNPARGRKIGLPRDEDPRVVIPELGTIRSVQEALPERYRVMISLLIGAGLRIGEALALEVSDVNFLGREIRVSRQRLQSGTYARLKTEGSLRTVPIGKVTTAALAAHLAEYGPSADGHLVSDDAQRSLYYGQWKRLLAAANRAVGADLGSHDCRHFAASALISGGASVKQVQKFLGHSKPTETLSTYAHLWPGDEDRTRAVLDAALTAEQTEQTSGDFALGG